MKARQSRSLLFISFVQLNCLCLTPVSHLLIISERSVKTSGKAVLRLTISPSISDHLFICLLEQDFDILKLLSTLPALLLNENEAVSDPVCSSWSSSFPGHTENSGSPGSRNLHIKNSFQYSRGIPGSQIVIKIPFVTTAPENVVGGSPN